MAPVARALMDMGCGEILLCETLGRATPRRIAAFIEVVAAVVPMEALAAHFHDT
ncbi:hypothetical protein [Breoghania sp.]|uniref:hypothetical protein n=1 Tax=Breoghania sp. TaxID=2065378 RepID=UPI0026020AD6|nr:hypothetical protein [Breoghania sp.]MDJ0933499.1 hypothetical protein [Breoghania sp.]